MEELSSNNKRVKLLRKYYESSKYRQNDNVYVIEGKKPLREAYKSDVKEIYVSEDFLAKEAENLKEFYDIPIYVLKNEVFNRTVRTETPQGVAAVMNKRAYDRESFFDTRKTKRIIICEHIQDPGNMGTIIRTAVAAGFDALVADNKCVDIYNPKCVSASMSGIYRLPILCVPDLLSTINELRDRGFSCIAAAINAKHSYNGFDYKENTAIIVGNEGRGLSEATIKACDNTVFIPMRDEMESLNVAVAAGILMYSALPKKDI